MAFTIRKKMYPLGNYPAYKTNETHGPYSTIEEAKAEQQKLKDALPSWDCVTDYFIKE